MSASFTVNCEGEGDRCVTEIVNLVTQEINATVIVTVPTSWWCSYLVNAIAARVPKRTDDETFVDVEFRVTNASEAGFIKEIEDMTDEQIQQLMEDFLEELDDDSEEEDNDND
tara:strand:+ start:4287 stop:4625 length:339 start_codon:yes stop_codon:yes gene_type:complete